MYKRYFALSCLAAILLCACDLQPRIASIPDSIGMFIEDRYPALLADPATQPEIYNSAASDYGVYASPELYGSYKNDDYLLYASVDDYVLTPAVTKVETTPVIQTINQEEDYLIVPLYGGNTVLDEVVTLETKDTIIVAKGDTVYSLARKSGMNVSEFAKINNLQEPYTLYVGQKLQTRKSAQKIEVPNIISQEKVQQIKQNKADVVQEYTKPNNIKRVDLQEITVVKGDTLYSLSREYEIPVNDLAVLNKLTTPFTLSVGQKIKVPKLDKVQARSASKTVYESKQNIVQTKEVKKTEAPKKISSNPQQKLPKISARSSSKFSWPVRGTILSAYGPKKDGLFNDGINISASKGTSVKAAENGVVAYAGNEVRGMGNLVIIQHSDGWMTVYAHLDSMNAKRGNKVSVGQKIGAVGKTGKVDKPQLHFEIRKGSKAYNPTQYLKK